MVRIVVRGRPRRRLFLRRRPLFARPPILIVRGRRRRRPIALLGQQRINIRKPGFLTRRGYALSLPEARRRAILRRIVASGAATPAKLEQRLAALVAFNTPRSRDAASVRVRRASLRRRAVADRNFAKKLRLRAQARRSKIPDLSKKSVVQLHRLASTLSIRGHSTKNRAQLVRSIRAKRNG